MSCGMSALVVCFACLSASVFLLLSVSCSRTWWALLFLVCAFFNSISALAGVLLSLCYLCAISCYLCAISVLSLCYLCAMSVLSLCYLCYLRWGTVLWSVLSLCYLCAIYAISCYLCAISLLSLWYLLNISLKSVAFTQTDAEDAAHPEGHAPQSRLAGVRGDWRSSHVLVLIVHMQWAFVKETMRGNIYQLSIQWINISGVPAQWNI